MNTTTRYKATIMGSALVFAGAIGGLVIGLSGSGSASQPDPTVTETAVVQVTETAPVVTAPAVTVPAPVPTVTAEPVETVTVPTPVATVVIVTETPQPAASERTIPSVTFPAEGIVGEYVSPTGIPADPPITAGPPSPDDRPATTTVN